jgi:hypothetical protein
MPDFPPLCRNPMQAQRSGARDTFQKGLRKACFIAPLSQEGPGCLNLSSLVLQASCAPVRDAAPGRRGRDPGLRPFQRLAGSRCGCGAQLHVRHAPDLADTGT